MTLRNVIKTTDFSRLKLIRFRIYVIVQDILLFNKDTLLRVASAMHIDLDGKLLSEEKAYIGFFADETESSQKILHVT